MRFPFLRPAVALAAAALFALGTAARAQPPVPVLATIDEMGNGSFTSPVLGNASSPGFLAPDPGPGGLASALTYSLGATPLVVVGDLILQEPGGGISDVIRFNLDVTLGPTLVFYSELGGGALADTGFPTAFHTNTVTETETVLAGGATGFLYTPTSNQPGFIPGAAVTYNIISDAATIPEPGTLSLLLLGTLTTSAGFLRRRRA